MKKLTLTLLVSVFTFYSSNSQYLKDVDYDLMLEMGQKTEVPIDEYGFSSEDDLPKSYSLEKYAIVADQSNSSSCTGFAIANGAASILYNLINGITRGNQKWVNRFDPFYVYCSLKNTDDLECVSSGGCNCGSRIYEGLDLLINYGAKKTAHYPFLKCSSTLNKNNLRSMVSYTGYYSIEYYYNFFKY